MAKHILYCWQCETETEHTPDYSSDLECKVCGTFYRPENDKPKQNAKHSTNAHTPGPWGLDFNSLTIKTDKEIIARVAWDNPSLERDQANARLIASAPELLEALKGFLPLIDSREAENYKEEIEAMEKAIAKAEGRE